MLLSVTLHRERASSQCCCRCCDKDFDRLTCFVLLQQSCVEAMKEKSVLYEVKEQSRTAVITLNRPRKQNAFNNEVYNSLMECLDAAESDTRVIAVVLTANGPAFSSGADLSEVTQDLADSSKYISIAHRPPGLFMMRLLSFKKLLIAAVNGPAVGKRCSFIMYMIMYVEFGAFMCTCF
jgi:enoyl-CoA hydratase/carnithine racemase